MKLDNSYSHDARIGPDSPVDSEVDSGFQNRPESTHAVTILISTLDSTLDSGSPLAGCELHLSIYIILHLFHPLPLCLPGHIVLHECCSYSGCIRVLKRQIFITSKNTNADFDS